MLLNVESTLYSLHSVSSSTNITYHKEQWQTELEEENPRHEIFWLYDTLYGIKHTNSHTQKKGLYCYFAP